MNAIHKANVGWLDPENILEASDSGTYRIYPIETIAGKGEEIKALKIPIAGDLNYYVMFRRAIGYDSTLLLNTGFGSEIYDGAMIHLDLFESGTGGGSDSHIVDTSPNSEPFDLIDAVLPLDQTFTDPVNNISITTLSVTEGYLEVQVDIPSSCPADLDGDGAVGAADLAQLLGAWGPNPEHPADFDGDGMVGAADLAQLLGSWGPCF